MKAECYLIAGNYYFGNSITRERISISFFLPLVQINSMKIKSGFSFKSGLKFSKEITQQPTNAGYQNCKLVTVTNSPYFVEMFMQKTGLNFTDKQDHSPTIHAPYLFPVVAKLNRIDFHNAYFDVRRNSKSGKFEKSLFFKKDPEFSGMKRNYNGHIIQKAY